MHVYERRIPWGLMVLAGLAIVGTGLRAVAQTGEDFDGCGVLVSGSGCVLLDTGGSLYVVTNTGRFQFGEEVRVTGTLTENCTVICAEADGCIQGATVYDLDVYPCGTPLPSFPEDIVTDACAAASGSLIGLSTLGALLVRRRQ